MHCNYICVWGMRCTVIISKTGYLYVVNTNNWIVVGVWVRWVCGDEMGGGGGWNVGGGVRVRISYICQANITHFGWHNAKYVNI